VAPISGWDRVAIAIEEIRARLLRCTAVLEAAGVPYAVIGGNAVAEWVGRVDKAAVRFTKDVDILLRREDLPAAIAAMENAGFVYGESLGVPFFLDHADASPRDAVHVIFGGEKVKSHDAAPAPDVTDVESTEHFRILALERLVQMKLTGFRRKDQVHLLDMLDVGLIDASWVSRYPASLAERLQELVDNPE
jgi:hypothetical protein